MGGVYNKWREDGAIIDEKRRSDVIDIDFNTTLPKLTQNYCRVGMGICAGAG